MKNHQRERVIVVSAQVQTLRVKLAEVKAQLAESERELDTLLSGGDMPAPAAVPLVERIVKMLDARPSVAFSAEELHAAMAGDDQPPLTSLRATLARLVTDRRILRIGRGSYTSLGESAEQISSEEAATG